MANADQSHTKIEISLYEFYAMGINSLLKQSQIEASTKVSAYRESFLYEQRLLAMSLLFLLGEEYVPEQSLKTMPKKYHEQVRHSVNYSIFLRALKHHFRRTPNHEKVVEYMMTRMESYISLTKDAKNNNIDPLDAITITLAKRVPPRSDEQLDLYRERVSTIFALVEGLLEKTLAEKYEITS